MSAWVKGAPRANCFKNKEVSTLVDFVLIENDGPSNLLATIGIQIQQHPSTAADSFSRGECR